MKITPLHRRIAGEAALWGGALLVIAAASIAHLVFLVSV